MTSKTLVINQGAWGVCGFTAVLNLLFHKGLLKVEDGRILKSSVNKNKAKNYKFYGRLVNHGSITNLVYAESILRFLGRLSKSNKKVLNEYLRKFTGFEATTLEKQVKIIEDCIKEVAKKEELPQKIRSFGSVGIGMTPEIIIEYISHLGFGGCASMLPSRSRLISKENPEGFKFEGHRILGLSKKNDKIDHWVYVGGGFLYNKSQVVEVQPASHAMGDNYEHIFQAIGNEYNYIIHEIGCDAIRSKEKNFFGWFRNADHED